MKTVANLITHIRTTTENTDVDTPNNIGIDDTEFIQYLNDAQYRLQSLIVQQHPDVFSDEAEITIDGSEKYDLATAAPLILINNKVLNVEYSSTGNSDDYYVLEETSLKNRSPGSTGSPSFYVRSSGKIIPVGKPSSGKLRVTYIKRLKELVTSVSDATKQTLTPELPEICERYIIAYTEWKILKRDSSVDSTEAMSELLQMQKEIVDSYKHINDDVQMIPEINQFDDWSIY